MSIGFTNKVEEEEEEYVPLYRTVIECPICKQDVANHYKGFCSCKNLDVGELESISKVRHTIRSQWTHFKTITYSKEAPNIYDVLLAEELP